MSGATHSRLSPSKSAQWIACPGSVILESKSEVNDENEYAEEGTAAHELLEKALTLNEDVSEFIGEKSQSGVVFTELMAEAVDVALTYVRDLTETDPENWVVNSESRAEAHYIHKDLEGTADIYVYNKELQELHIIDYKHGFVDVEAEWNPQLLIYTLGVLPKLPRSFEVRHVNITIIQPNTQFSDPIKNWIAPISQIEMWVRFVLLPAIREIDMGEQRLAVGKHCRYCTASITCPAYKEKFREVSGGDVDFPNFTPPQDLEPGDISKALHFIKMFKAWADKVGDLAFEFAQAGQKIPDFKLVKKSANRAWIDEGIAEGTLESYLGDAAFERKLLSVAKAEKQLKKLKINPEDVLSGIWEKPEGGLTLAPESDRRKEVSVTLPDEFYDNLSFLN